MKIKHYGTHYIN